MVQLIRNFNPEQQHPNGLSPAPAGTYPTLGYLVKLALVAAAPGSFFLEGDRDEEHYY